MKPRDELWDALTAAFGEVRTKSERGRRNRAIRELREAEVTPHELEVTLDYCRSHFSHFTEMALCNWLSRALQEEGQRSNVRGIFDRMKGAG